MLGENVRRGKRGKPALLPGAVAESRTVSMLPSTVEFFRTLGQGNLSAGVRAAEQALKAQIVVTNCRFTSV